MVAIKITAKLVEEILTAIRSASPLPIDHPAHALWAYQIRRQQVDYLAGDSVSLHIWADIFEALLFDVLGKRDASPQIARQNFQEDVDSENKVRQAYSLVYYTHFVAEFIDMKQAELEALAGAPVRTQHRRKVHAFDRLATALTKVETQSRQAHQAALFRSRLPYPAERAVVGRDAVIRKVLEALEQKIPVYVSGIPGMGKTALLAACAHRLIPYCSDVVYVRLHPHEDCEAQLRDAIGQHLYGAPLQNIGQLLIDQDRLLVLDNVAEAHLPALGQLRDRLNTPYMLCAGVVMPADWQGLVLPLEALDESASRQLYQLYGNQPQAKDFDSLFAVSGGVPGAMIQALHQRRLMTTQQLRQQLPISAHYAEQWQQLPIVGRSLWLLANLLPQHGLTPDLLAQLEQVYQEDISSIVQQMAAQQILVIDYRMPEAYRLHANATLPTAPPLDVEDIVDALQACLMVDSVAVELLENGIAAYLTSALLQEFVLQVSAAVRQDHIWERWAYTLKVLHKSLPGTIFFSLWETYEQARLDRWRGKIHASLQAFASIAESTGRHGEFALQAAACYEAALACLYMQTWQQAADYAEVALRFYKRRGEHDATYRTRLALIQALVELQPQAAYDLLQGLPDDPQTVALSVKVRLALGHDLRTVQRDLEQLMARHPQMSEVQHGRFLMVLAMIWHQQQQTVKAIELQTAALSLLEPTQDLVSVARGLNNLGVFYAHQAGAKAAQDYWQQAMEILRIIQDPVTFQVVQHNLSDYAQPQTTF